MFGKLNKRFLTYFNKNLGSSQRYTAFTLAEVLIVIGIIGIIAAITIPSLVNNIHEKQYKSAAKVAYSKTSQAIEEMKADNGGYIENAYDYTQAYTFYPVFEKYFKILKYCGRNGAVPEVYNSNIYTSLAGVGGDTAELGGDGQFITQDGMFYNIQQEALPPRKIIISVDVNGLYKKPNKFGIDTFMFEIANDNLLPEGSKGTLFPANRYCTKNINNSDQGAGCMYYVMQGIDY